jgi:hypothetical protein
MKICKKCNIEKAVVFFNKWYKKNGNSGFRTYCKDCDHKVNKEYREKNKENLIKKRRENGGYEPKKYCTDPSKLHEYERIYRSQKKYPEKVKARNYINSLIRIGKVIRPSSCESCLKVIKIEAHHEDYNKPLEVKWLCKSCHTEEHWGKYG